MAWSASTYRHLTLPTRVPATIDCFPLGLGQRGEGVCLLLQIGPYRILLDCGLPSLDPLLAGVGDRGWPADLVFCSHAHPDHGRSLLNLHSTFPDLPIYTSHATLALLTPPPPSSPPPAAPLPSTGPSLQGLNWRTPHPLAPGLTLELWPAGHLPGAAIARFCYSPTSPGSQQRSLSVIYTGDFLLSGSRLTDGVPLEELRGLKPDVLIIEGSLGSTKMPRRRQQENQLAEQIVSALNHGQSILLPVPSLGPGQELLMLLRSHHQFTGRDVDIWVDEPIAQGCDRYTTILSDLPLTVQNFARHQPLFWDDRVKPRVHRLAAQQRLRPPQLPCIVLTHTHANWGQYVRIPNSTWQLLLPEHLIPQQGIHRPEAAFHHQSERSLRTLQTLSQSGQLQLSSYHLADHSDGNGTTQLIHNLRPQHVVFIHGSEHYLSDLANLDELHTRYQLHLPSLGTPLSLPLGPRFQHGPAPAPSPAEGEIQDTEDGTIITLPERILTDPRWQRFAATGLVELRWQGEELVIRGLSPNELASLSQTSQTQASPSTQNPALQNQL